MFKRFFVLLAFFFGFSGLAAAADVKVAVVDFQRALNEVNEAAGVRTKLESMYSDRKAAIEKMQKGLLAKKDELDKQTTILSDSARKAKEDDFTKAQVEYQQTASRYESEMQQAYGSAMQDFIDKMKKIAVAIGQERGYTVVLEATEGGVVYWADTVDITDELIKRYNAANPAVAPKK